MGKTNGRIHDWGWPKAWRMLALVCTLTTALAAATTGALARSATAHEASSGVGRIMFSLHSNRSHAKGLANQKLKATRRIYVFMHASSRIARVSYHIDDTRRTDTPWSTTAHGPYDFNGGAPHGNARGFDLGALADIKHTITAAVTLKNGTTRVVSVRFQIRTIGSHQYNHEKFGDEFNGAHVNSHWNLFSGPGNAYRGVRTPFAVGTDRRGNAVITASMVNGQIASGGLQWNTAYTYGHYEVRVRTETDSALNMSGVILLWPASMNRVDGEEDFYETLGKPYPLNFFLHDLVANPAAQDYLQANVNSAQWHTVAFDWQPHSMTTYLDGVRIWSDSNPAAMTSKPHRLSIQFDPSSLVPLPGPVHMYIDYARFYQ